MEEPLEEKEEEDAVQELEEGGVFNEPEDPNPEDDFMPVLEPVPDI